MYQLFYGNTEDSLAKHNIRRYRFEWTSKDGFRFM